MERLGKWKQRNGTWKGCRVRFLQRNIHETGALVTREVISHSTFERNVESE